MRGASAVRADVRSSGRGTSTSARERSSAARRVDVKRLVPSMVSARAELGGETRGREIRGCARRRADGDGDDDDDERRTSTSPRYDDNDEGGETREDLLDGLEVFALASAVAVKARAATVERDAYRAAQRTGQTLPPRALTSAWVDVPLYAAVIAGTVLRRIRRAREEGSVSVLADRAPTSLRARLAALEQAQDGVLEISRRTAREVSRLGTRVRLTRREISPPLRKVQAESLEHAQILVAAAEKIEQLERELGESQDTMSGLHSVSSKQFDVLSKAIAELKTSQIELNAALATARAEAEALRSKPYELAAEPARERVGARLAKNDASISRALAFTPGGGDEDEDEDKTNDTD